MEFWGVEVKPGQSLKVQPEYCKLIHISQASLGETKDGKGPQNVPLRLKVNGKDFVIGSLAAEERSQLMFDLVFEKEFELSHGWKNGSVYFLGYIADDQVSDGEGFSDSESEDELVAAPKNVNAKPKPEIVAASTKANGATKKEEPASDEDEDDSDDDEDDDIDSDDLMESSDEELPQVRPLKKRPAESPKNADDLMESSEEESPQVRPLKKKPPMSPKNAAPGKKAKPEQKGSPFASKATGGKPQQGGNKKPQQGGNKKPQGGNKFNGQKGKAGGQRRS